MAYAIAVDNILSLNLDALHDGGQLLLTTHWKVHAISPSSSVDSTDLWTEWASLMNAVGGLGDVYAATTSEAVTDIKYVFQLIHPIRYVKTVVPSDHPVGEVALPAMPPNVAHVIVLRADAAGPHNVGTKHIGGVPSTFTEGGLLTTAGLDALLILAVPLKNELAITVGANTVTLRPVIYNRAAPATSVEVTNAAIGSATRVMRRRTKFLGS